MEYFFDYLDGPVICLSSQDVPTPYSGPLEELTIIQPAQIVETVKRLCSN
jgi:pyruvate dehydrogenase E1 component beta subunit